MVKLTVFGWLAYIRVTDGKSCMVFRSFLRGSRLYLFSILCDAFLSLYLYHSPMCTHIFTKFTVSDCSNVYMYIHDIYMSNMSSNLYVPLCTQLGFSIDFQQRSAKRYLTTVPIKQRTSAILNKEINGQDCAWSKSS